MGAGRWSVTDQKPSLQAVLLHYHVEFHPNRRRQKIKCPIHGERNPSCTLTLDPGAEWFNCFSCGAKGDVYEFVKGMESCDFQTARNIIEGIPGAQNGSVQRADEPRRRSVSDGSGDKPRYRRAVPARVRRSTLLD